MKLPGETFAAPTTLLLIFLPVLHGLPALEINFEDWPDGHAYNFKDDGIETGNWSGNGMDKDGNHRAYIDEKMPARPGSSKALRVAYPADAIGPNNTGVQEPLILPGETEYYLSYFVRFDPGFPWGKSAPHGGKLPGLASGGLCSGGIQNCSGRGFTARYMWNHNPDGRVTLYLYHLDKPGQYGDHKSVDFTFQTGTWHHIIQRVKQNDGNSYDGIAETWIDGKLVQSESNLRFDGSHIDRFYFSTFVGGGSSSYALPHTSYIWFDDIIVSKVSSDIPWTGTENRPDDDTGATANPSRSSNNQ